MIIPRNKILDNINIVLVSPQIADNIGLAARALKNTSFKGFSIVSQDVPRRAFEVAKHARDILEGAKIFPDLTEALADSHFVLGATRRFHEYKFIYDFNDIKHLIISTASKRKISIIFGQENYGLSKESIEACDSIFYIPANEEFPSYNLAAAVVIVCHELFNLAGSLRSVNSIELASRRDIETLFGYLEKIISSRLDKRRARSLIFTLQRIVLRTHLTKSEVSLIKGLILKRLGLE